MLAALAPAVAQVPAADTTIFPVITDNLPMVGVTTSYNHTEADVTSDPTKALPLFAPYDDQSVPAFWDFLISEQQQARIPLIMLMTSGLPAPLGGVPITNKVGSNPYYIPQYLNALSRAGAADTVKFGCCPLGVGSTYHIVYNVPSGTPVDFANEDSWENVWWKYEIGPWFANIPKKNWFLLKGGVPIEFWGLGQTGTGAYTNQQGNISRFFTYLDNKLMTTYGVHATFIICDTATNYDTTLASHPRFLGLNPWFTNSGYGFLNYNGVVTGTMVPGFNNGSLIISRKGAAGTGANGDTLKAGLDTAVSLKADLASLEGWVDIGEGCASWLCSTQSATAQTANWDYPSQYVNILRSYTDLRTATLRLEAENCDKYNAPGSTGGIYRRSPSTLGISALSGSGWAVTNTTAGEWLEWDGVVFSPGNYKFPIRYASTASHTVQLSIDGTALTSVSLPSTGSMTTYANAYAGTKTLTKGIHTIKLSFVDGGVNLDWLFVKKYDSLVTLKSSLTNCYVTAALGGNQTDSKAVISNQTIAGPWENFTADDLSGGTLTSGDSINLQTHNGSYLTAQNGGGTSNPQTNRRSPGTWEGFTIVKTSGSGAIASGDTVALRTSSGTNYLTVKSDGTLDGSATTIGAAQTFTIGLSQLGSVPADPSNFTAAGASGSSIGLSWTNNATGQTGFMIQRSTDGGNNYSPLAYVGPTATSYTDSGLSGYATFTYRVAAMNPSANSNFVIATGTSLAGIPATPLGLSAMTAPTFTSAPAVLSWSPVTGATSYLVKRSTTSGGPYTTVGTPTTTTYTDSTVVNGTTYYYVVAASNSFGASGNSSQVVAKANPFTQVDIGTGTGSGSYSGGIYTLTGSGGDITNAADRLHFAYIPLNGDGTVVAHLATLTTSNGWTKSGVMIRETLTDSSANALMSITGSNGSNFQYRLTTSGTTNFNTRISGIVAPQWVMLVRSGNLITGYFSADGTTWTQAVGQTFTMASAVYVGLAESQVSTATFDYVRMTSK
jgi:hypothetical protein